MSVDLPLVSVVIPAYNSQRYVGRAIRSVLAQSYRPIECIVVDDGSTDQTAEVIASFGAKVRTIRQRNAGASAARNAGIDAAVGRFIAFLDSDDYWLRTKLEMQVGVLLEDPSLVLVAAGLTWIGLAVDPDHLESEAPAFEPAKLERYEGLEHLVLDPYLGTPTVVVDAAAARAVGGFDTGLPVGEDVDFYFRICVGRPYAILRQPLVRCQLRHGSLTTSSQGYACNLQVLDRLVEAHPEFAQKHAATIRSRRHAIYTEWIESLIFRGDGFAARRVLAESACEDRIPAHTLLYRKSWFARLIRVFRLSRRRLKSLAQLTLIRGNR